MSGGPPHHPHNRQVPAANTAWNHLQVPSYFPGQPQLAHSSSEHIPYQYQPTWHKPALPAEAMKMFKMEPLFPRDCVDLSRNGNQNGELLSAPISLSVRDANKINSLPASALDIQAVELTRSPGPKVVAGPGPRAADGPASKATSPGLKPTSPGVGAAETKTQKRSNVRVDSILERLNPEKVVERPPASPATVEQPKSPKNEKAAAAPSQSVIVQAAATYDESSSSSSVSNVPTSTGAKDDDAASMHSNEDSLDGNKSRRKRKPSKTVRVSKDEDAKTENTITTALSQTTEVARKEPEPICISSILEGDKMTERRRSSDDLDAILPAKTRRKTSSESETIDDIAAMVQEGLKEKEQKAKESKESRKGAEEETIKEEEESVSKPISVSVIKTKDNLEENTAEMPSTTLVTPAQKKAASTNFVEVENKLEEMFAGIEDGETAAAVEDTPKDDDDIANKLDENPLKMDEEPLPSTSQDVTSTSTEVAKKNVSRKVKRKVDAEGAPKKRGFAKRKRSNLKTAKAKKKIVPTNKNVAIKETIAKDVYAYDSGSNASSSKSRGPFIQIRGPRESPISVNVVNTINDDEGEKKVHKLKKFHDDSEYRHKVRSKGLHCSTLSNKYDAQTKDATWICAFCKRGPHANSLSGPTSDGRAIPAGDLFGPYFINTRCAEFERRLDDPFDRQFKSRKITKALAEVATTKAARKQKRKHSDMDDDHPDVYLGIIDKGNGTYEIWAHEDCIVWSPGVYLVGPKIVGFEEAVWSSCNVPCRSCHLRGANVCCLRRGCLNSMHLCCARQRDWQFKEETYRAYCPEHRVP